MVYIKNIFIGFILREIQDMIHYVLILIKSMIDDSIIFVDFIKAFDSLEWDFMYVTLKHFGFNNSFIKWVKALYSIIRLID